MGVQIETLKDGDNATFPQKGQKVGRDKYSEDSQVMVRSLLLSGLLPLCPHPGEREEG